MKRSGQELLEVNHQWLPSKRKARDGKDESRQEQAQSSDYRHRKTLAEKKLSASGIGEG